MATKTVKKTVAFFEIRDKDDQPMAAEDWQKHLRKLSKRQANKGVKSLRHKIYGLRHYAQSYAHDGSYGLVIARERDEPPSSLDETSGEILDEATQANRPWVEVCVASFIPGTNIFGFVLGGMSSPRSGVIADWINTDKKFFAEPVSVHPYRDEALVDMLRDGSSEARMVHLVLTPDQIQNQNIEGSGLYSAAQHLGRELDLGTEVEVEVILRIAGRTGTASEGTRRQVADRARELIGMPVKAAKAEIVELGDGNAVDRDLVDLVKHRMATTQKVSVMDDDGRQVRIPSALNAISRAASHLGISSPSATAG